MKSVRDRAFTILEVFVAAVAARFGWEFGGWLIQRLF